MPANLPALPKPRVVVIGGGFAGINLVTRLRHDDIQVVMVDRNNHHTFQPLLYQVATSGLEAGSIAYPLRKIVRSKNFYFRMTEVTDIIPAENRIKTVTGYIDYDYLVIATGAKTNYFGMQDVAENSMPLKSVSEAINLRHVVLQNFEKVLLAEEEQEKNRLLTFVVAGGGPTGVELCGALSEFRKKVVPKDYKELDVSKMRIVLLDPGTRLLGAMSEEAGEKAEEFLRGFGVEIMRGKGVKSFNGREAILSDGSILKCGVLIWAAGVTGDLPAGLGEPALAKGNRINVDEYNRVVGYENIFAIGDIAAQADERYERGLPGLAPVAIQQGKHLAKNIRHLVKKEKLSPFKYFDKGSLAAIGRQKAVADLSKSVHFQGYFAWLVWLVVHLFYLIGFRNKLMVVSDWLWNYITYDKRVRLIIRPFRGNKA